MAVCGGYVSCSGADNTFLFYHKEKILKRLEYESIWFIINKNNRKTYFQKIARNSSLIACFGAPIALTTNNEIIFIAEPVLLNELSNKYKILSALDKNKLNDNSGYVLLKFKIGK